LRASAAKPAEEVEPALPVVLLWMVEAKMEHRRYLWVVPCLPPLEVQQLAVNPKAWRICLAAQGQKTGPSSRRKGSSMSWHQCLAHWQKATSFLLTCSCCQKIAEGQRGWQQMQQGNLKGLLLLQLAVVMKALK
jgi:hypothetical protein